MNDISTRALRTLSPVGRDVRRCHSLDAKGSKVNLLEVSEGST